MLDFEECSGGGTPQEDEVVLNDTRTSFPDQDHIFNPFSFYFNPLSYAFTLGGQCNRGRLLQHRGKQCGGGREGGDQG